MLPAMPSQLSNSDEAPQRSSAVLAEDRALVYNLARRKLTRLAQPWWSWMSVLGGRSSRRSIGWARDVSTYRLDKYVLACSAVTLRMSPTELQAARVLGRLPPDFYARVRAERKARRKLNRGRGPWA